MIHGPYNVKTQLSLSFLTLLIENETLPNSPRRRNGATKPQRNERNENPIPPSYIKTSKM